MSGQQSLDKTILARTFCVFLSFGVEGRVEEGRGGVDMSLKQWTTEQQMKCLNIHKHISRSSCGNFFSIIKQVFPIQMSLSVWYYWGITEPVYFKSCVSVATIPSFWNWLWSVWCWNVGDLHHSVHPTWQQRSTSDSVIWPHNACFGLRKCRVKELKCRHPHLLGASPPGTDGVSAGKNILKMPLLLDKSIIFSLWETYYRA